MEIIYPKGAHLLILTDKNWICTDLQKNHSSGEQNLLVVMEILNNAHNIPVMDLGDVSGMASYIQVLTG